MEKLPVLPEENLILIDWFTFTVRGLDLSYVKEILLGLSVSWEEIERYMNGYPKRLYFGGISIMYGGTDEMGICVNFSGQGCRTFETYSCITWNDLFAVVLSKCAVKTGNITRLDVAFDDHSGILNLTRMQHDCEQDLIVSKFRKWSIEYGSDRSMCIYHGSKKSDIMIRIYDKAVERGYDDDTHWVRVEMQLRDDLASSFVKQLLNMDVGTLFSGTLVNYLRYVEPADDLNKSRWPLAPYWDALINGVNAIRLWSAPGVDYNMTHLENFVIHQTGNAIRTYIKIAGSSRFFNQLHELDAPLSTKYKRLLQQYGYDS